MRNFTKLGLFMFLFVDFSIWSLDTYIFHQVKHGVNYYVLFTVADKVADDIFGLQ